MSYEQWFRESQIDRSFTRFPLRNPIEQFTARKDDIETVLGPELIPSVVYENIVTAMDVFSYYSFAYPTCNQDEKSNAKIIILIKTKHASLPTKVIFDKGSAFMSHVI